MDIPIFYAHFNKADPAGRRIYKKKLALRSISKKRIVIRPDRLLNNWQLNIVPN